MARKTAKATKPFPDLPWLVEKARAFRALTNEEKAVVLATETMPSDNLLYVVVAYVKADAAAAVTDAALDAIRLDDHRPGGLAKGFSQEDFETALQASNRATHRLMNTVDAWQKAAKFVKAEEARRADPAESTVPKEDAKVLIAEAFSESAEGLIFNIGKGIVAHRLTEAVYGFVVREEAQEVPLCPACR